MATTEFLWQPDGTPLGAGVLGAVASGAFSDLDVAVAFVKSSGVRHVLQPLADFSAVNPGHVRVVVGIDEQGSSLEAVQALWTAIRPSGGEVYIVSNPRHPSPTFHPKVWWFRHADGGTAFVGSGNLTQGGLFTNYEGTVRVDYLDSATPDFGTALASAFQHWTDETAGDVVRVTEEVLRELHEAGALPSEATMSAVRRSAGGVRKLIAGVRGSLKDFFTGRTTPAPPALPPPLPVGPVTPKPPVRVSASLPKPTSPGAPTAPASAPTPGPLAVHDRLFIDINMNKKTEVHLAKKPLDEDPAFFQFPFTGLTMPTSGQPHPEADPRPNARVTVRNGAGVVVATVTTPLKMWFYETKKELRVHFESAVLDQIADGSVLIMSRDPDDDPSLDYSMEFLAPGSQAHAEARARCTTPLPGGARSYGWA